MSGFQGTCPVTWLPIYNYTHAWNWTARGREGNKKTRKCDLDDTVYEIEKEIEERRFFKIYRKFYSIFNELCLFHTYGERNFEILTCFGSGAFTIKCITVVKRVEKLFQVVNFPGGRYPGRRYAWNAAIHFIRPWIYTAIYCPISVSAGLSCERAKSVLTCVLLLMTFQGVYYCYG